MKIRDICKILSSECLQSFCPQTEFEIKGIQTDSRLVQEEDLFIACMGEKNDGHLFIEEAIFQGAKIIIYEDSTKVIAKHISHILVKDSKLAMAKIVAFYYNYPSKNLCLLGVTGTNGKTTISFLAQKLFEKHLGKSGRIGTIDVFDGENSISSSLTTPDNIFLQRTLTEMLSKGCRYIALEVSSHSLVQKRVSELEFDFAIYTNLGSDHLEYHGSKKNYYLAKRSFFEQVSLSNQKKTIGIIGIDDIYGKKLYHEFFRKMSLLTYGTSKDADFRIANVQAQGLEGTNFDFITKDEKLHLKTSLLGIFNLQNLASVLAVAKSLEIDLEEACHTLGETKIPGRLELICSKPFSVFLDYAHNPESLELVCQELAQRKTKRLLVVFGCGGERDKQKRPIMGKIASSYADICLITSDNPRSENPEEIIQDIRQGLSGNFELILDRREAIERALKLAQAQDIVCILGKGHENYQELEKGKKQAFSDKEIVKNLLSVS